MGRKGWLGGIALVALVWWGVRSIPPPAVLPAGHARLSPEAIGLPEAAELVAVATEDGVTLRGWFLPSDPGAPVVLHFLPTGFSATDPLARGGVAYALADLGLASLVIDYRGVGASEGHVWPQDLEADARACWAEALERAGGDPERVFLRGSSIGALACAELLEDGLEPAGVILRAPLLAETVAARFVATWTNDWIGGIAGALLGPIADADLVDVLERTAAPLYLVHAMGDELLSQSDRRELLAAAERHFEANGKSWAGVGHAEAVHGSFRLMASERDFLERHAASGLRAGDRLPGVLGRLPSDWRRRIERDPEALERLAEISGRLLYAEAEEMAALALARFTAPGSVRALVDDRHPAAPSWLGRMARADRERILDLDDPSGPLCPEMVAHWVSSLSDTREDFGATRAAWASLVDRRPTEAMQMWISHSMRDSDREGRALSGGALPIDPGIEARRVTRAMLKGLGVLDRLASGGAGGVRVEARFEDGWTEVDPAAIARFLEPIDDPRPPPLMTADQMFRGTAYAGGNRAR